MNFRLILLFSQIYVHIGFLLGLYLLPWTTIIPTVIVCQIIFVGLCGTVFYHRIVTHKNPVNSYLEKFLIFLSWIGLSGSALGWAATHRQHHRFSDTERDPHSPIHMGKIKTYWYSSSDEKSIRYVPDLARKPLYVWQHKNYFTGIALYHLIILACLPLHYYWILAIVPAFLMWFAGSMTNIYGHNTLGPTNNTILGILFAGEGWHKNHHDNSNSLKFHHRADWGYYIYRLISR